MMEFDEKIDLIHENVSIYALFAMSPFPVKYDTDKIECQISCPFHGRDLHKSARVYPDSNSLYCWSCDQTWDVIDYWAQVSEMWKDDGTLNRGHAINDLMLKFGLRSKRPDWERKLTARLKKFRDEAGGYEVAPENDRIRLRNYYELRTGDRLRSLSAEHKVEMWPRIQSLWDALDEIDIRDSDWKGQLTAWSVRAGKVVPRESS